MRVVREMMAAFLCGLCVVSLSVLPARAADTADVRVNQLLGQMTVAEKAGQLNQLFLSLTKETVDGGVRDGSFGSFLYAHDTAQINYLQHIAVEQSRLHIPLIFALDVINGYRTIFPAPIGLAASWDPDLVENARHINAREARAAGIAWTFAPMVDIARDPRWGRIVEGAGEDPYLGAAMARAQVRGFQGSDLSAPDRILATAKHFAAYGAAVGGRDYEEANVSDSDLWNVYFPPFHAAVDAGVGSVMSAYQDLNDVPANGNRWLLHDVLRDAFGFRGFVVSDAFAIRSLIAHGFAADEGDAAVRAVDAGVAVDMNGRIYIQQIPDLIKSRRMTVAQLDTLVRPFLKAKVQLGLFEHPYTDESKIDSVLTDPAHRAASRDAAERSAVLLKNDGNTLPLNPGTVKSIALIGPLADSQQDLLGPWTTSAEPTDTVSVLDGLRHRLPTGTTIRFAQGVQISRRFRSEFDQLFKPTRQQDWTQDEARTEFQRALDAAQGSDVAVLVLGERFNMSGEKASRESLDLPGDQEKLLEGVVATGKPVIVVLVNGRSLNITWAAAHVPAILEAWYPGTEGGNAIARLLFGDANPGGKLPVTWPRDVGQVPMYYNHNLTMNADEAGRRTWDEESTPLYPFGYGLSYARFDFANLKISEPSVAVGKSFQVSVDVENTSDRAGDEVVQLYIHQRAGSASRPVRALKGFQRVTLQPHARTTVQLSLGPEELRYWSSARRAFVQEPAEFDLWVGADSAAPLHGTFTVHP